MGLKKTYNILIVDDTPKNIQLLGEILSQEGYELTIAQDGQQALNSIEESLPDLILMDVMMPVMDGYEACQELKQRPETSEIPLIFLTAKTDTQDIIDGFNAGAVDYVTKPFQREELLARVRTHLALKEAQETANAQAKELKELVHILSHDLSNHIQSMIMVLHSTDGKPEAFFESRGFMKTMANNGKEIINMVRQMRAIAEGKMKMKLEPIDLGKAVDESVLSLSKYFAEKKIRPILELEEHLLVYAEKTSLVNSVINNLLTNAIKFSYSGSVVTIKSFVKEGRVMLEIQDQGTGIEKHLIEKLFDMNTPTTRAGTNNEKGTGFGMPLIEKFMHTYNGSIHIDSKPESTYPEDHGTSIQLSFYPADS